MDPDKKFLIIIGDGMADFPIESLGNRTPLEAAKTPNMDRIAREGITGLVRTVPEGMHPGSDTANLSIFGYNPLESYTGRAPLEAINMGIELGPKDVAFRCNMVDIRNGIMHDFSGGHVDTELSEIIMAQLASHCTDPDIEFHPGVSYRNIVVWRNFPYNNAGESTPPHDIQGQKAGDFLPAGPGADLLKSIMDDSARIISESASIKEGISRLKGSPTSVWLWGGGFKPAMDTLQERFGLHGHTISAVDLIHGIGRAAGLTPIDVEGATGYIDTNYTGKADALLEALDNVNFVFLHVESPDESGHEGNLDHKIQSIEDFDEKVVGRVMNGLKSFDDYTVLIMPDHPTPVSLRTHTADPVPFCLYCSNGWQGTSYEKMKADAYSEKDAAGTGLYVKEGHRLIELMIQKKLN